VLGHPGVKLIFLLKANQEKQIFERDNRSRDASHCKPQPPSSKSSPPLLLWPSALIYIKIPDMNLDACFEANVTQSARHGRLTLVKARWRHTGEHTKTHCRLHI
jgi:hypothetical protein